MLSSMSVTPTRFCAALVFTLAVAPGLVRAAAAEAIETRIERQGDFITVNASALMQVDARIAWEVLSDYDNLAQFIPDMKTSRIVSREGNRALVAQKGEACSGAYSRRSVQNEHGRTGKDDVKDD